MAVKASGDSINVYAADKLGEPPIISGRCDRVAHIALSPGPLPVSIAAFSPEAKVWELCVVSLSPPVQQRGSHRVHQRYCRCLHCRIYRRLLLGKPSSVPIGYVTCCVWLQCFLPDVPRLRPSFIGHQKEHLSFCTQSMTWCVGGAGSCCKLTLSRGWFHHSLPQTITVTPTCT